MAVSLENIASLKGNERQQPPPPEFEVIAQTSQAVFGEVNVELLHQAVDGGASLATGGIFTIPPPVPAVFGRAGSDVVIDMVNFFLFFFFLFFFSLSFF